MIALAVIVVPIVFAVVTGLAGSRRRAALGFGLFSTLATFVLALFLPGSSGISTPWIPGIGVTFTLSPTGAGSVLTIVAALTMIPTVLMAARRVERDPGAFVALLLLMQGALAGIFLARDLVLFYVSWEAALIPSMLMLGTFGRDKRRAAVLKYLVYAIGGSFLMLISILAIRPLSGAASPMIKRSRVDLPQPLGPINTVVRPGAMDRSVDASATVPPYRLDNPLSVSTGRV